MSDTLSPSAPEVAGLHAIHQAAEVIQAGLAAGRPPDLPELTARFPAIAARLPDLVRALTLLHRCGDGTAVGPAADGVPEVLGDFRLLRLIGRGGMGVVFEAEQVSLNRRVALKVLPAAARLDPQRRQRFHLEAQAAALLHHAHVVPVFAVGEAQGVPFYAMQFIAGHPLTAVVLARRGEGPDAALAAWRAVDADPYRAAARVGAQAAAALEHAHQLGVIHRDVKPANLLLDAAGHVWLADFGLARLRDAPGPTHTGDVVGTVRYVSPEQALARHDLVDHRADVYGLGATLYELLTLAPAVPGDDRAELLRRIAQEEPRPPRRLDPAIPADLETIVLKCLVREPAARYATAQEAADDLGRFLRHEPIRARPPGAPERARRWLRRHPAAAAAAAAILAATVVLLGVGNLLVRRERDRVLEQRQVLWEAVDQLTEMVEQFVIGQPGRHEETLPRLRQIVATLDFLARDGDAESLERLKRARAYRRLGQVSDQMRDLPAAEAAHRRAIGLLEPLAAAEPQVPAYRQELAHAYFGLGRVLGQLHRPQEFAHAHQQALDVRARLVADFPAEGHHRFYLAQSYSGRGQVRQELGRLGEAQLDYEAALAALKDLPPQIPAPGDQALLRAEVLAQLGILWHGRSRPQEALSAFRQALAAHAEAPAAVQARAPARHLEAILYLNLGAGLGDPAEAEAATLQAVTVLQGLRADFPGVPSYRQLLARCLHNVGAQRAQARRHAAAVTAYRQALAELDDLARAFPADRQNRPPLALCHHDLGLSLKALGRPADAEQAFRRAAAFLTGMDGAAAWVEYRHLGKGVYQNFGDQLMECGRPAEALTAYRQALPFWEALAADSAEASLRQEYALFLADCRHPAIRDPGRAVALARRELRAKADDGAWWFVLGIAHYRAGQAAEAVAALLQARARRPGPDCADRFFLALAHFRNGQPDAAARQYDAAVRWMGTHASTDATLLHLWAEAAAVLGRPAPAPKAGW